MSFFLQLFFGSGNADEDRRARRSESRRECKRGPRLALARPRVLVVGSARMRDLYRRAARASNIGQWARAIMATRTCAPPRWATTARARALSERARPSQHLSYVHLYLARCTCTATVLSTLVRPNRDDGRVIVSYDAPRWDNLQGIQKKKILKSMKRGFSDNHVTFLAWGLDCMKYC